MSEGLKEIVNMMAVEKTVNLIFNIEMALHFFNDNKIKPDEAVVKALGPLINELDSWIKQSSH